MPSKNTLPLRRTVKNDYFCGTDGSSSGEKSQFDKVSSLEKGGC
ncbi:hypothetical protein I656_00987 [Geobacillus sp. WSUCF1]|nr:hypothetical protein I656_00987 [Geobacillus sp. WSUCF1]